MVNICIDTFLTIPNNSKVGKILWPSWIKDLIASIVIVLASINQVASVGSKIILEKDWIIVVSRTEKDRLANINSVLQTIDLTTFAIAPLVAGLIFEFISYWAVAVFIGGLNLVNVVLQIILLK